MCGIAGFWGAVHVNSESAGLVQRMVDTLTHRGPNDTGIWVDADAGIALGHRRLSVLDLSPAGHQPMTSVCGRFVIVFNGEIYNHRDLRNELETLTLFTVAGEAYKWKGHSDTETLLAGITAWGVEATLKKTVGMFAFALWDRAEKTLTLARDRLGEKPLYYGIQGSVFMFGSELKALRAHPAFRGEIDRDAIALFLRHNYIPAPYSIYQGIHKLPPGTWVKIPSPEILGSTFASLEKNKLSLRGRGDVRAYWSAGDIAKSGQNNLFDGSESEAIQELGRLLKHSIKEQMIADVPLGAFLSGGVDSSTIVALMQAQSNRPIKTFTIGFHEQGYNEAEYARAVSDHLGTEHTELYVSPEQATAVIPYLPHVYDEPFSDSSQIPTWLVSKLASEQVTVSLSGDGGDELFGGYNRYFLGQTLWQKFKYVPKIVRGGLAEWVTGISPQRWNSILDSLIFVLPERLRYTNLGDKLHKLAGVLRAESPEGLYLGLISHWDDPAAVVLGCEEHSTILTAKSQQPDGLGFVEQMMLLDIVSYLPDDILVKIDRAAMSVSLETRVPFLDHRVVEFAWKLPLAMKVRNGQGKHVLRQLLYQYVPPKFIERPKMGFGVPLDVWLRGPLREWAESLLDESRLRREGYLDPAPICLKWKEHLSGRRNWQYHLWDILMFQTWLEQSRG